MSTYRKTSVRLGTAAICLILITAVSFTPIIPGSVSYVHAQTPEDAGLTETFDAATAGTPLESAAGAVLPTGLPVKDVAVFAAVSAMVPSTAATAGATAATAATTGYLAHIKPVLDGLAWAAAKAAIQVITKSMVNWINHGFNGSPSFVTNLNATLLSVSDGVANQYFNSLSGNTGGAVKSPFQDQVTQQLKNNYLSSSGRAANAGYTLNQFSTNPAAFLNGNAFGTTGGFNAWFAAVGNDQNNPYGAAYAQQNALSATVANAQTNQKAELNWGKGFLSYKGPCTSTAAPKAGTGGKAPTSLSTANNCTSNSILTPGSTIETTLGITATSPLRQLELANSINEIVGALATQLVTQVIGPTGLSGVSQPAAGGGASILTQATDPSQYTQASAATGFIASVTNDLTTAQTYLLDWRKLQTIAQTCTSSNTTVSSALALSNSNVARGTTAVNILSSINTEATAAAASGNAIEIASTSTAYQNLAYSTPAGGNYITTQDLSDAQFQSTANMGTTASTSSLYSQLTAICTPST